MSGINSGPQESNDPDEKWMAFVLLLNDHKILFNRSQTPHVKQQKDDALKSMVRQYHKVFNSSITKKQLLKKVNNLKAKVKKKLFMTRRGNLKITFKPWEKLLLDIMHEKGKPVLKKQEDTISPVSVKTEDPEEENNVQFETSLDTCSIPIVTTFMPKPFMPDNGDNNCVPPLSNSKLSSETNETKSLTNSELQRLVLLENLKLLRLQQEEVKEKMAINQLNFALG